MIPAADRAFLAELCRARAGLLIDPERAYLIETRLAPVARREAFDGLAAFVAAVREGADERLVWLAVEALALSETSFFRDPPVFAWIGRELPGLVQARAGDPLRVACLGCGHGQEVYSLAMIVEENRDLADRVEILGVDISERALEMAQSGLYSQFEVQRGLPARRLVRHLETSGDRFALASRVRRLTRWRRANLLDDPAPLGRFDLVLCRYVLSQLAPAARERVVANVAAMLAPGGRVVLGLDEAGGTGLHPVWSELAVFEARAEDARRFA